MNTIISIVILLLAVFCYVQLYYMFKNQEWKLFKNDDGNPLKVDLVDKILYLVLTLLLTCVGIIGLLQIQLSQSVKNAFVLFFLLLAMGGYFKRRGIRDRKK